jgi:hypothetical protein
MVVMVEIQAEILTMEAAVLEDILATEVMVTLSQGLVAAVQVDIKDSLTVTNVVRHLSLARMELVAVEELES